MTSMTPAPEVTVNFMARSPNCIVDVRGPNAPKETPRRREFRRGAVVNRSLEDKRPQHKFALTALARSIDTKVEAGKRLPLPRIVASLSLGSDTRAVSSRRRHRQHGHSGHAILEVA